MGRRATMAVAAIGICGAVAAPAGMALADDESATEVISRLQSQGYTVTLDKIGSGPIEQCQVTNVRNPQRTSQLVPYVGPGNRGESILIPQITSQTVSVSLDCTR